MNKVFVVTGILEQPDCLPEAHGFTNAFPTLEDAQEYMKDYWHMDHPVIEQMMNCDDYEEHFTEREHTWFSPSLEIYFSQMIHEIDVEPYSKFD
jgi:hypothetical protein